MRPRKPSTRPARRAVRGTHRQTLLLLALACTCLGWAFALAFTG